MCHPFAKLSVIQCHLFTVNEEELNENCKVFYYDIRLLVILCKHVVNASPHIFRIL